MTIRDVPIRVVEWSTGYLGRMAVEAIDARPELELVGVFVSDPAKVGVDAGRLAGMDRDLGVAEATHGKVIAHLVRANMAPEEGTGWHRHEADFQIIIMIKD